MIKSFCEVNASELTSVEGGSVAPDPSLGVILAISFGIVAAVFATGTLKGLNPEVTKKIKGSE